MDFIKGASIDISQLFKSNQSKKPSIQNKMDEMTYSISATGVNYECRYLYKGFLLFFSRQVSTGTLGASALAILKYRLLALEVFRHFSIVGEN